MTPSEAPATEQAEPEPEKASEAESGDDSEKAELAKEIKEHSAALEEKQAIIADVCNVSLEEAKELAENPENIDPGNLMSVKNILDMM